MVEGVAQSVVVLDQVAMNPADSHLVADRVVEPRTAPGPTIARHDYGPIAPNCANRLPMVSPTCLRRNLTRSFRQWPPAPRY